MLSKNNFRVRLKFANECLQATVPEPMFGKNQRQHLSRRTAYHDMLYSLMHGLTWVEAQGPLVTQGLLLAAFSFFLGTTGNQLLS